MPLRYVYPRIEAPDESETNQTRVNSKADKVARQLTLTPNSGPNGQHVAMQDRWTFEGRECSGELVVSLTVQAIAIRKCVLPTDHKRIRQWSNMSTIVRTLTVSKVVYKLQNESTVLVLP